MSHHTGVYCSLHELHLTRLSLVLQIKNKNAGGAAASSNTGTDGGNPNVAGDSAKVAVSNEEEEVPNAGSPSAINATADGKFTDKGGGAVVGVLATVAVVSAVVAVAAAVPKPKAWGHLCSN